MIVDCHTHILPDSFRKDKERILRADATFEALFGTRGSRTASCSELLSSMDKTSIDSSIALGYGWTSHEIAREANDYILESAINSDGRILPFCSVNPAWGIKAVAEIERCAEAGAIGIGELHPDTQGFNVADPLDMNPIMGVAKELDLTVLCHASEPIGHSYPGKGSTTPEKLFALAAGFSDVRIIFAHWGGGLPFYSLMPEIADKTRNVWFDSAASPYLYNRNVFAAVSVLSGVDHILFGSDFPLVKQSKVLEEVKSSGLPESQQAAVLGGNATRILGL